LIAEAESGGNGVKECLVKLSREILIKHNSNLQDKPKNLKDRQYEESQSSKIAAYIEINNQTLRRNNSLLDFVKCLQQLDVDENKGVADFAYDLYLLAIAKLLHDQYFRLLGFYFHTLIQQRQNKQLFLDNIN